MEYKQLFDVWYQSSQQGCELHGHFTSDGTPMILQTGSKFNVLVDVTKTNTFHTHPDVPDRMNDIIEFAGCDPPSGQDVAVLLLRYHANKAHVNTDTVVSRHGIWTYSIKDQLVYSNPILSSRDYKLVRSYYQWCQLLLLCGYFTIQQYIKWVEKLDPISLSLECEEFLSQGQEAHKYVYGNALYNVTHTFPLTEENKEQYKDIVVRPGDITIERKLWIDLI